MSTYKLTFSDNDITISRKIDTQPPKSCPMHTHDRIELYYFISGNCKCNVEGTQYILKPRDIAVIRPYESHMMRWKGDEAYERVVLMVSPKFLEKFDTDGKIMSALSSRPAGTGNIFSSDTLNGTMLYDSIESINESTSFAAAVARILLILTETCGSPRALDNLSRSDTLCARMIDYINENLYSAITIEQISNKFFISRSQINRLFKKNTGSSVYKYITTKRMYGARLRIKNGESIMSVATDCGHSDYSSFYRAYKGFFGVSPKDDKN